MKKYNNLKNASYRVYKKEDFSAILKIFIEFQKESKIGSFYNITKGHSDNFITMYLFEELKKLTKNCKHNYVGIDNDTGEIFGFACLTEDVFAKNSLELQLAFKHPKYIFNRQMKYLMLLLFKKIKKDRKVFAVLGQREKFEKYFKFIKRIFKVKVYNKDSLGKIYIEFL